MQVKRQPVSLCRFVGGCLMLLAGSALAETASTTIERPAADIEHAVAERMMPVSEEFSPASNASALTVRLATAERFAPYAFRNESGEWTGIDYDIVKKVFDLADVNLTLHDYPRARITLMLEKQQLDGLLTTTPYNDELMLSRMWRSHILYHSEVSVFGKKSELIGVIKLEEVLDASKYRLGILNNFGYRVPGHDLAARSNLISVHRDEQLVDLLLIKRIDMAVSEDISFIYAARHAKLFEQVTPVIEVASRPISVALLSDLVQAHPELTVRIDQAIREIKSSGYIDTIMVKYLSLE